MYPGKDPYFAHYYRISFDGSGLTRLTDADANHAVVFTSDMQYYVDTYSRIDMPPVAELRRTDDNALVSTLERGDITELLRAGWKTPEVFVAKGRDRTTDIWGIIVRPSRFDPSGWPIGPQYSASSNVDNAYRLQGDLLLVVGELDTNVDPSSTMQVVNQLIKHNKNFDLLVVPGANHPAGRGNDPTAPYGDHKRFDFFVQHLLGVTPPPWNRASTMSTDQVP